MNDNQPKNCHSHSLIIAYLFHIILLSMSIWACQPPVKSTPPALLMDTDASASDAKEEEQSALSERALSKADPQKAKAIVKSLDLATLRGQVETTAQDPYLFPRLQIELDGANFVELLRCPDDKRFFYHPPDGSGGPSPIDFTAFAKAHSFDDIFGPEKYEYFWSLAADKSTSSCKLVGTRVVREIIFDLSAETGKWYYIINPCISRAFTMTELVGCSNRIVISETIDYTSEVTNDFRTQSAELSNLEAKMLRQLDDMSSYAVAFSNDSRACETKAAVEAHNKAIDNAWRGLIGGIIGGVIGFSFGGFEGLKRGIKLGVEAMREDINRMERYAENVKKYCTEIKKHYLAIKDKFAEFEKTYKEEVPKLKKSLFLLDNTFNTHYKEIRENNVESSK
ncbi:MAG: hypothetical protein OXC44_08435 [Proteobacteria bacterium]|nr:hypothetical protein [Pseudomonadota bacterium]